MLFPNSEDKRREYWQELDVQNLVRIALQDPTAPLTMIGSDLIRALRHNARAKVRREAHENHLKGVVAGKLVAYIHALASADVPEYVGVNSAVAIIRNEELAARSAAAARRQAASRRAKHEVKSRPVETFGASQIKEQWTEYRPVAHLWAAYLYQAHRQRPPNMLPTEESQVERFWDVAYRYLSFGESFKFQRVNRNHAGEARLLNRTESLIVEMRTNRIVQASVPLSVAHTETERLRGLLPKKRKSRSA